MIKPNYHYSSPSRLDRMLTSTRNAMDSISKLVGKIAEYVTYMILTTVFMVVPIAAWLGIPAAIAVCFNGPLDTQGKALSFLGGLATWTILCFLVLVYLNRPGKPTSKKH